MPFLTRDAICALFGLPADQVRVLAGRVGGGFGGKQEMLTEDIVALAVLATRRPVQLELTREEEFTAATTRHAMAITVRLGATRDGTLTALQMTTVADTGAYGNHAGGVLFHSCEEAVTAYRCPNKKVDGVVAYTTTVPAGAFRGYGMSQSGFAMESAIDELARRLHLDPVEFRRRNLIKPGEVLLGGGEAPLGGEEGRLADAWTEQSAGGTTKRSEGSRSRQKAPVSGGTGGRPPGDKGAHLEGYGPGGPGGSPRGGAVSAREGGSGGFRGVIPPGQHSGADGGWSPRETGDDPPLGEPGEVTTSGHQAFWTMERVAKALASGRGEPSPGGAEWRQGCGIAVTMLDTIPPGGHEGRARITQVAGGGYRLFVGTAEFGNGTTTVHRQLAASALGCPPALVEVVSSDTDASGHDTGAYGSTGTVVAGTATLRAARALAALLDCSDGSKLLEAEGYCGGTERGVTFCTQGFRVAVNMGTGEVRMLQSVQAVDAGTVINPAQLRGQVQGGVAQALGAALFEEVRVSPAGEVTTRALREYHVPVMADVPRTEVLFAPGSDPLGPLGAKPMSEAPFNPVAPALANAIRDATGVRVHSLPMRRDVLFAAFTDSLESGGV